MNFTFHKRTNWATEAAISPSTSSYATALQYQSSTGITVKPLSHLFVEFHYNDMKESEQ